jgi:hypothetical protein
MAPAPGSGAGAVTPTATGPGNLRRRVSPRALIRASVLAGALAAPQSAAAVTETASAGQVSASFSYERIKRPDFPFEEEVLNPRLTIARDGALAYDQRVCVGAGGCKANVTGFYPVGSLSGYGTPSIRALDLESGGEPAVTLQFTTGGNPCCAIFQVFWWDAATSSYASTEHEWFLPPLLEDLGHNGRFEFMAADARMFGTFTSAAGSGYPLQIFTFHEGTFTDVTRSYPALIRSDALKQFKYYERFSKAYHEGEGYLGAWVADECLLGRKATALGVLARENKRGRLRAPARTSYPQGSTYITKLLRLLRRLGYIRG